MVLHTYESRLFGARGKSTIHANVILKKKKKNGKWKWYELKVDLKTSILNMIDKYLEMIIVT